MIHHLIPEVHHKNLSIIIFFNIIVSGINKGRKLKVMMFYYLIRFLTSVFEMNYQNQLQDQLLHPIESYFNLQEEYPHGTIHLIDPFQKTLMDQHPAILSFPILPFNYPQEKTALG